MSLSVEFAGDEWTVGPEQELTFGRAGDVCIDDSNLYLHRIVGVFRHRNGDWWLHNLSEWTDLDVRGGAGSRHTMAPHTRLAIVTDVEVRFRAGKARYAIEARPANPPQPARPVTVIADAPSTSRFGMVPLNAEQRLLLAALCEHQLDGSEGTLPSNRVVARRLGWSLTKFNRKLDYLCRRLDKEGVAGLRGPAGGRAAERRERLVDHAIHSGLITAADLRLLEIVPE